MNVTADLLRTLRTNRKDFDARCEMIAALVQRNDKAACEAITRIYDRQTADEKQVNHTKHDNGIGFQQCDAKFGGFIARLYRSGHMPYADRMVRVRRMAVKYRAQLAVLSFLKDMAKSAPKSAAIIEAAVRQGFEVRNVSLDERAMQAMEAAADRAQTVREETAKQEWKRQAENVCPDCNVTRCPDGCCCAC